jgi:hypothetical protein
MKIAVRKFGEFLVSRPAGKEAAAVIQAYFVPATSEEAIELDFEGVLSVGPSWLDEVVQGIKAKFRNPVVILDAKNASVIKSMEFIEQD